MNEPIRAEGYLKKENPLLLKRMENHIRIDLLYMCDATKVMNKPIRAKS